MESPTAVRCNLMQRQTTQSKDWALQRVISIDTGFRQGALQARHMDRVSDCCDSMLAWLLGLMPGLSFGGLPAKGLPVAC